MKKIVLTLAALLTLSAQAGVILPTMSLEDIFLVPQTSIDRTLNTDRDLMNRDLKRNLLPTMSLEETFIIPQSKEGERFQLGPQLRR